MEELGQNVLASDNQAAEESVEHSSQERSTESSIETETVQMALPVDQIQSSSGQATVLKVL